MCMDFVLGWTCSWEDLVMLCLFGTLVVQLGHAVLAQVEIS